MKCRHCGAENRDGAKFCRSCGAKLTAPSAPKPETVPMPEPTPVPEPVPEPTPAPEPKPNPAHKKSPSKKLLIAAVVVVAAVAVGEAVFFLKLQKDDSAAQNETVTATEQTEATEQTAQAEQTGQTEATAQTEPTAQTETAMAEETPAALGSDTNNAGAIHTYQIIPADVTWEEAFELAKNVQGGYLAHINSQEELDAVTAQISAEGYDGYIFWLGGRRDGDSEDYYWLDVNGAHAGNPITELWLEGEPSYYDSTNNIEEYAVDLLYSGAAQKWVLNDVPNDLLSVISYQSGKLAYIVEIE